MHQPGVKRGVSRLWMDWKTLGLSMLSWVDDLWSELKVKWRITGSNLQRANCGSGGDTLNMLSGLSWFFIYVFC